MAYFRPPPPPTYGVGMSMLLHRAPPLYNTPNEDNFTAAMPLPTYGITAPPSHVYPPYIISHYCPIHTILWIVLKSIHLTNPELSIFHHTFVVKRQAEEVGKRTPDKLRVQGNYKHKTRARFKNRARK